MVKHDSCQKKHVTREALSILKALSFLIIYKEKCGASKNKSS